MSSHDYRLGHMLGYNEARGRAEHELAQKDAIIRTMRTAADTKNQIISNYDNAIRNADDVIELKDKAIKVQADIIIGLQATNAALQQSLDEATAKINGESDGFQVGDIVKHATSHGEYKIFALNHDKTRAQFVGYLTGWSDPEHSWFPLSAFRKIDKE